MRCQPGYFVIIERNLLVIKQHTDTQVRAPVPEFFAVRGKATQPPIDWVLPPRCSPEDLITDFGESFHPPSRYLR